MRMEEGVGEAWRVKVERIEEEDGEGWRRRKRNRRKGVVEKEGEVKMEGNGYIEEKKKDGKGGGG